MKVGILGAGVAGMSAAFDLTRHGHQVVLYEASSRAGGLASGFKDEGWDWSLEKFYHHWFTSDQEILKLIDELGRKDKVIFRRPFTAVWYNEQPYALDSPLAVLTFPGLSLVNRLRFGLVTLFLRLTANWQPLEQVTADEWMRKWYGEQVYDRLLGPMLVGKFSEKYYRSVNMAWMWARMHTRSSQLGTYQGGFQAFVDDLAAQVQSQGAEIRLNCPVRNIQARPGGGVIFTANGQSAEYDAGLVTVAPHLLSRLAPDLPANYLEGLNRLQSLGAVVLILALDRKVTDWVYWLNIPKSEGFPFLAFVEHTNFLPSEYYGGDHLVYLGDYLPTDHPYFQMSQEELLAKFLPPLKRFNPSFDPSWVRKTWLFRESYAQPVPLVNHSQNVPSLRTPLPGLYFASMSQVYPWDRGTNFAVELGRRVGRMIEEDIRV